MHLIRFKLIFLLPILSTIASGAVISNDRNEAQGSGGRWSSPGPLPASVSSTSGDWPPLLRQFLRHATPPSPPAPLFRLLDSLGLSARPRDEIKLGRDRSVSVLGMPVGQYDGLLLSPLSGLSLGNSDLFGPVAVNDRYSIQWDFMEKLAAALTPAKSEWGKR